MTDQQLSLLHRERIAQRRVSTEAIIDAYRETSSIWKAAKQLGICGQSLWERLKIIGYPMPNRAWTRDEKLELTRLIDHCTLSEIGLRLGRPYAGVAAMASRMGIVTRAGNKMKRKIPRGIGLDKKATRAIIDNLTISPISLRQFCRARGFSIDSLALAIQKYEPEWWRRESEARGFTVKVCPNCGGEYYPMSSKQATCTRTCGAQHLANQKYFAGRRNETIGLRERVCQICLRANAKGLSSHHVLGKEHDPEGRLLVALCPGCHQAVGRLANLKLAADEQFWQRLIELVLARRLADQASDFAGTYVCVDLEYLTRQQCIDEGILEADPAAELQEA